VESKRTLQNRVNANRARIVEARDREEREREVLRLLKQHQQPKNEQQQ